MMTATRRLGVVSVPCGLTFSGRPTPARSASPVRAGLRREYRIRPDPVEEALRAIAGGILAAPVPTRPRRPAPPAPRPSYLRGVACRLGHACTGYVVVPADPARPGAGGVGVTPDFSPQAFAGRTGGAVAVYRGRQIGSVRDGTLSFSTGRFGLRFLLRLPPEEGHLARAVGRGQWVSAEPAYCVLASGMFGGLLYIQAAELLAVHLVNGAGKLFPNRVELA